MSITALSVQFFFRKELALTMSARLCLGLFQSLRVQMARRLSSRTWFLQDLEWSNCCWLESRLASRELSSESTCQGVAQLYLILEMSKGQALCFLQGVRGSKSYIMDVKINYTADKIIVKMDASKILTTLCSEATLLSDLHSEMAALGFQGSLLQNTRQRKLKDIWALALQQKRIHSAARKKVKAASAGSSATRGKIIYEGGFYYLGEVERERPNGVGGLYLWDKVLVLQGVWCEGTLSREVSC